MDYSSEESQIYQPTYSGIHSNNDYEEQQQTYPQELPYDEIQQILSEADSITSRREIVLVFAINYLQDKCSELSAANESLHLKLQQVTQELLLQKEVEIGQEMAQDFLEVMETEIEGYKRQLLQYRLKYLVMKSDFWQERERMRRKVEEFQVLLGHQEQEAGEEKREIEQSNLELLEINEDLNNKIEGLEQELASIKAESKYRHRPRSIDNSIQVELESLIEKLMNELQSQRNQKYKISNECKMIQKSILQLEREIAQKNNRIYQLEMISLKSNRTPTKNNSPHPHVINGNGNGLRKDHPQPKEGKNGSSSFRTFSLVSLLNEDPQFNKKTRYLISLKVIEFYLRKLKKGDLSSQTLQSLLVYNYSSLYPQACIIRKNKNTSNQVEYSEQKLIWNLGVILDTLLSQDDEQSQKMEVEAQVKTFLTSILKENGCSLEDVKELKMLVEEVIRCSN